MNKNSIRTIYLYIFSLLGLVLLTIGGVRFIDMGLKAFVFTKADEEQNFYLKQPPIAPISVDRLKETQEKQVSISESEKAAIGQWLNDYQNWQNQQSQFDPATSRRHRDASINLALILAGLPLYLSHWRLIKKESKDQLAENSFQQ